jgi:hypothetical protein
VVLFNRGELWDVKLHREEGKKEERGIYGDSKEMVIRPDD